MVMPHIGAPELIIILVVILIFFGVGKLPQAGSAIGKGIRAFRKGQQGEDEEEKVTPATKRKAAKKTASTATRTRKS